LTRPLAPVLSWADNYVTEGNMHEMKINGERRTYREPDLTEFPPATLADLVYNDAAGAASHGTRDGAMSTSHGRRARS
jgi:hypothetical protein